MASSLSLFRKHQRVMIAVLGVLIMIAFSLGGLVSLEPVLFGSRGPGNPVVATTSFGEYRESDLQSIEMQRQIAKDFVRRILYASIEERQMSPQLQNSIERLLDMDLIGPLTERSVIESRVLAELAREQGLVVDDGAITDFLRVLTGDMVPAQRFQEELSRMRIRGQQRVAKSMVYDALRTELLARNYKAMFASSLQITPAQRWDYYQRLKRRVRAEMAPVAVADFLAQVPDPGDARLTAFFNDFKDVEPKPGSPDPGFKIPTRASVDYFVAHYEHFFDPATVTAADVKAHYEKFKDVRYQYNALSESDLDEPEDKPEDKPATKPEDKPATKPDDKPPAKPEDKPATKPEDKKPEDKKPEVKKPDDKSPAKPDDKPPATPDDKKPTYSPDSDEESSCLAVAEETESGDGKAQPASETKAAEAAAEKPAAEKPAENKPAAEKAAAAQSPPSPPPALTLKYALPRDVREGAKRKYEPFWKVEPEIRRELAGDRAAAATRDAVLKLQGKLRKYSET